LDICAREDIRLIVPTTDIELVFLAPLKEEFAARGITILVSDPGAINICDDKYLSYLFLREAGLPVPATFLPDMFAPAAPVAPAAPAASAATGVGREREFPLFIKPRQGRGSMDCFLIRNRQELEFFTGYITAPVIQECLNGPEYTIDLLADFTGEVVSVVPRERIATAAGVSQKGRTVKDPALIDLAIQVSKALRIIGPANIQCFAGVSGTGTPAIKIVEINPRFAGGYPLTHASGVSFPGLLIKMMAGERVPPCIGDFVEGMMMMRFDEGFFLHQDYILREG
jgi:carbamoyl-phosphate synthase large subunit